MRRRPRSLAAVLVLTALSLLALALTGLMEWISAVLFLVMEFTAEFLRPMLEKKRRRPSRRSAPAPRSSPQGIDPCPSPATTRRVKRHRQIRMRRPTLCLPRRGRSMPPI